MKKPSSKTAPFNIRNKFRFLGGLSLVFILSLAVWSSSAFSHKVYAENEKPLYKMSLEDYLRNKVNELYTWDNFSNEDAVSPADRLPVLCDYYRTQINPKVAASYGWPTNIYSYNPKECDVDHNDTEADTDHDLYLLEFSTGSQVNTEDIDIYYSVYFLQKGERGYELRYTEATELSEDSCDFLERESGVEFCEDELEMTTIQIPQNSVPVGVFVWQADDESRYAWELSYLNMYKLDSISDVISQYSHVVGHVTGDIDYANNYRTFTGTLVGTVDADSIAKNYMGSQDGSGFPRDGVHFEWLYPLSPAKQAVTEYVLEVVTKGPKVTSFEDIFRSAYITLKCKMNSGKSELSKTVMVSPTTLYESHPFRSPEDYNYYYAFEFNDDYINPIAQNAPVSEDFFLAWNAVLSSHRFDYSAPNSVGFPDNNKLFRTDYDMEDRTFWTLPGNLNYNFTKMNEFAAMMLGNYFDAFTMSTGYLKEYRALQIPITLPVGIQEITEIESTPYDILEESYLNPGEEQMLFQNYGISHLSLSKYGDPMYYQVCLLRKI